MTGNGQQYQHVKTGMNTDHFANNELSLNNIPHNSQNRIIIQCKCSFLSFDKVFNSIKSVSGNFHLQTFLTLHFSFLSETFSPDQEILFFEDISM